MFQIGVASIVAFALGATSAAAADIEWTRVAVLGDPAPGGDPSEEFGSFGDIQVLADGTTYFVATIGDAQTLFRWTPQGGLVRVWPDAIGAPIPGSDPPLVQAAHGYPPVLQYWVDADHSLLIATGIESDLCGEWPGLALLASEGEGPLSLVAQSGQLVPTLGAGWRFSDCYSGMWPAARSGDVFLFPAQATQDPSEGPLRARGTALFARLGDGSFVVVAAAGAPAPEIPGATFERDFSARPGNQPGAMLVRARIRLGPSGPFGTALYRWSHEAGLELLARTGQHAPSGGVFGSPEPLVLAADGSAFFRDEPPSSTGGVYRVDPDAVVHEIARIGAPVPGAADGSTFTEILSAVFASNGVGALEAWTDTPAGSVVGLWRVSRGGTLASAPVAPPLAIGPDGRLLSWSENHTHYVSDGPGPALRLVGTGDPFEFTAGAPQEVGIPIVTADPALRWFAVRVGAPGDGLFARGIFVTKLPEPRAAEVAALLGLLVLHKRRSRWA